MTDKLISLVNDWWGGILCKLSIHKWGSYSLTPHDIICQRCELSIDDYKKPFEL